MSKKLRVLSLLLVLAMAFGLFAGCSKDEQQPVDDGDQPSNGGDANQGDQPSSDGGKDSIIIATANETPSLSPVEHNAVAGDYMNGLTYATLFRSNLDTLEPEPYLVDTYESVSDTEWQFKLKEGVKYHNGETMTAEDVKASIEWAQGFAEVSLYNSDIVSIEVVDELTFKITTEGPDAMLLSNLSHHGNAIVPKALIDSNHDFNTDPVGAGPYKFVNWNRGDSVEFEAFEDYFLGAPSIKHMTWKIIPEGSSRTIALEAGEVDFIIEVEAMDGDRLKENSNVEVIEYNDTSESWLMLNN